MDGAGYGHGFGYGEGAPACVDEGWADAAQAAMREEARGHAQAYP